MPPAQSWRASGALVPWHLGRPGLVWGFYVASGLRPTLIITMSRMKLRAMNQVWVASIMHQLEVHGVHGAPGDLTNSVIVTVIGALTIIVMVMIAVWQHRQNARYRKADRALQNAEAERKRLQSELRVRRDFWQPIVDEIRALLVPLEEIEAEVLEQGPLDHSTIDADLIGRIQRRLEGVSRRCPASLHDPLSAVASAVAALGRTAIPSDVEVTDHYYRALISTPPLRPTDEVLASAIEAKAIAQYRAAKDLQAAIAAAWKALRMERGVDI